MKKIKKISILLTIIVFTLMFNSCYAIDLNLTDPIDDVSSSSTNSTSTSSNSDIINEESTNTTASSNSNEASSASSSQENTTTSPSASYGDSYSNTTSDSYGVSNPTTPTSTTVSAVSSDDGLKAGDIINIFVIVIGLILIFLGIAILLQLKK